MKGFIGKLLVVNLSTSEISEENIDNNIASKFLGGAGYACRYLFDKIKKDTDPLSPDNRENRVICQEFFLWITRKIIL